MTSYKEYRLRGFNFKKKKEIIFLYLQHGKHYDKTITFITNQFEMPLFM